MTRVAAARGMRARAPALLSFLTVVAVVTLGATPAAASTATASLTAGALSWGTTPGGIVFSTTLTSFDQSTSSSMPLDVSDLRGSGGGWNITATSTIFASGTHTLPNSAVTVPSASAGVCDAGSSCTPLVNSGTVAYPYTLPAGATAPTATRLVSAAVDSGMGAQTITPTFQLGIPSSAYNGTYNSTWTFSLVSGP